MRIKWIKAQTVALITTICCCACVAFGQEATVVAGSERAMYARMTARLHSPKTVIETATTPLQTWNGSFTYQGTTYTYNMVGVPPFPSSSATIPAVIIPVKVVLSNGATYDPSTKLSNGNTVITNTVQSPIFSTSVDFTSDGVDMGSTQYIDAFRRANFWDTSGNPSHLLLGGPTVLPEQTLKVPKRSGSQGTVFGFRAGLVDINYFDSQLQTLLTNLGITPNVFPIFLTYDVYLTQNRRCCIGGYHSSTGLASAPQSYAHATYVDHVGSFAQDVSALSHEVGEWADDPLVVNTNGNNTPCGTLENGDPLENNPNFGAFSYVGSNGFTYNLQDLVTLEYFGAPTTTSVGGEFTFQHETMSVCQNGS